MARRGSTGEIRVWLCPAIANIAAPTVAEITAGVDVTPWMRRDGLTRPRSGATIDASDAASRTDKTAPGNIAAGTITYRGQRDSVPADDDAFTAFAEDTKTFMVIRDFGGSTVAAAAAQKVDVHEGTVLSREKQPIGDDVQNFLATLTVEDEALDVAVVAGA